MNGKNTAVKRILGDIKELKRHPSPRYRADPLEDNLFEWHFTIRGPSKTDFDGGIYHGRILLPSDYPFKPPNIVFLTKNGRFEVGTKICLSISSYHEESWQPAWGVRTMLEAIISFLPSEGAGAIGALDWTTEERKKLAVESHDFCCSLCGKVSDLLLPEGTDEEDNSKSSQKVSEVVQDTAETSIEIATETKEKTQEEIQVAPKVESQVKDHLVEEGDKKVIGHINTTEKKTDDRASIESIPLCNSSNKPHESSSDKGRKDGAEHNEERTLPPIAAQEQNRPNNPSFMDLANSINKYLDWFLLLILASLIVVATPIMLRNIL